MTATRRPFGSTARCTWPIDAAAIGVSSNSRNSFSSGQLELLADHALHIVERERLDVVLERAELRDDVRRDDVRAHREQLPELDERRPELVEHLAEVLAARGRRGRVRIELHRGPRPRQQVGQLVGLEEVAEAVANCDLRDLREAAEIPLLGRLRHALSVAARAEKALLNAARALEQPQPVLELGEAELQLLDLLARNEADLPGDAARLSPARSPRRAHRCASA